MANVYTTSSRHVGKGARGNGSASSGGGYQGGNIVVNNNGVTEARLAELMQEAEGKFLRKDQPDTTEHLTTFNQGVAASQSDVTGTSTAHRTDADEGNIITLASDRVAVSERISLPSHDGFTEGLTGQGGSLWIGTDNLSHLDVDILTVRQTLQALQFKIKELAHVGAGVVVSPGATKVKSYNVTTDSGGNANYWLELEDMAQVATGDLLRCSRAEYDPATGNYSLRSYWLPVIKGTGGCRAWENSDGTNWLFNGTNYPHPGDEVIVMGNVTDLQRQGFVLIALTEGTIATECSKAHISVYDGVNAPDLTGCERCRLGDLTGLMRRDGTGLTGYGLWGQTVVLSGDIEAQTVLCPRPDDDTTATANGGGNVQPASVTDNGNGTSGSGSVIAGGDATRINGDDYIEPRPVSPYIATLNEHGDGILRQYYPIAQGGGIRYEHGYDATTGSLQRYYNTDGTLRWMQGSADGLITSSDISDIRLRQRTDLYLYHSGARLGDTAEQNTLRPLGEGQISPNTTAWYWRGTGLYYAAALNTAVIPDGWYVGCGAALRDFSHPTAGTIVTIYRPVWHIVDGAVVAADNHNVIIRQFIYNP